MKTAERLPNGLPQSTVSFFQEYDPATLDLDRDWMLVVERVLRYGNRTELRWLFDRYGQSRIADWTRQMGTARLPRRHLWFWWAVLDLEGPVPSRRRGGVWPH